MKYPNMSISCLRFQTFDTWSGTENIDKEVYVEAGFFYTGNQDHVRCFECGIGLRNWQADDNPMVEHARWSPQCKYLIEKKGVDFVEAVQIAVQQGEIESILEKSSVVLSVPENEPLHMLSNTLVDRDTLPCGRRPTNAERKNPLLTDAAQAVFALKYLPKPVSSAVNSILAEKGWHALSAENIMLAVIALIPNGQHDESIIQPLFFDRRYMKLQSVTKSRESYQRLLQENSEMKERLLCKICCEDTVSVAFLPCGHLSCCSSCAPSLKVCPLCRTEVKGSFKVNI